MYKDDTLPLEVSEDYWIGFTRDNLGYRYLPKEIGNFSGGSFPTIEDAPYSVFDKLEKEDLVEIVFVVEEGIAKSRPVKIGISDENYYQVKEGLQEGEEIVTGPFKILSRTLKDGDFVKVENQKERSEKREKK